MKSEQYFQEKIFWTAQTALNVYTFEMLVNGEWFKTYVEYLMAL